MKLEIDIPLEYVDDFNNDKFSDFFHRVIADICRYDGLCGLYEKEIAYMFLDAFKDAKIR